MYKVVRDGKELTFDENFNQVHESSLIVKVVSFFTIVSIGPIAAFFTYAYQNHIAPFNQ